MVSLCPVCERVKITAVSDIICYNDVIAVFVQLMLAVQWRMKLTTACTHTVIDVGTQLHCLQCRCLVDNKLPSAFHFFLTNGLCFNYDDFYSIKPEYMWGREEVPPNNYTCWVILTLLLPTFLIFFVFIDFFGIVCFQDQCQEKISLSQEADQNLFFWELCCTFKFMRW